MCFFFCKACKTIFLAQLVSVHLFCGTNQLKTWTQHQTIVKQNQQEYYTAIMQSDREASSTPFIVFMFGCLKEATSASNILYKQYKNNFYNKKTPCVFFLTKNLLPLQPIIES